MSKHKALLLNIGGQICALRMERHWTQEELAKKAKTKQQYISRIEHGEVSATMRTLLKFADVFEKILLIEFV